MEKNIQERLNSAKEIWQRYIDNLEEVSKMKEKMLKIISKAIKYEFSLKVDGRKHILRV